MHGGGNQLPRQTSNQIDINQDTQVWFISIGHKVEHSLTLGINMTVTAEFVACAKSPDYLLLDGYALLSVVCIVERWVPARRGEIANHCAPIQWHSKIRHERRGIFDKVAIYTW